MLLSTASSSYGTYTEVSHASVENPAQQFGFLYFDYSLVESVCCVNRTGVGRYVQVTHSSLLAPSQRSYQRFLSLSLASFGHQPSRRRHMWPGTACRSVVVVEIRVRARVSRGPHCAPGSLHLDPKSCRGARRVAGGGSKVARRSRGWPMQQAHAQAYPYNIKVGHGLSIGGAWVAGLPGWPPFQCVRLHPAPRANFPLLVNKSWPRWACLDRDLLENP